MATVAISCVVDNHPKFVMQAYNLIASLRAVNTCDEAVIILHHTGLDEQILDFYRTLGVELIAVNAFGTGNAVYCNKLTQLHSPGLDNFEYAILCDADVAFLNSPVRLADGPVLRAKPVDFANPPIEAHRALYEAAGLAPAAEIPAQFGPGAMTLVGNMNGGLYVIPRAVRHQLRDDWIRFARLALGRGDILGGAVHHADQIGLGMAIHANDCKFDELPLSENFPTHLSAEHYHHIDECVVSAFHYHANVDNHGLPKGVGVDWIDGQVSILRQRIAEQRRVNFSNRIFWDFRYSHDPELGSGVGSRGAVLEDKRAQLAPTWQLYASAEVIDIGCGDLETTFVAPFKHYHGIDTSPEALKIAWEKRPDWNFSQTNIADIPDGACDLAICLDVLIHQSDPKAFNELVNHLCRIARETILVSGYEDVSPPPTKGLLRRMQRWLLGRSARGEGTGIVFRHENLRHTFLRRADVGRVDVIGGWRDVELLQVTKSANGRFQEADIAAGQLGAAAALSEDPELLRKLVAMSRDKLRFFPETIIRSFEYPWFASRMRDVTGQNVLDVGAGVSVMPLWLADQGAVVTTVDLSSRVVHIRDGESWNEWGFLDYAAIDPRIRSFNLDMSDLESNAEFDIIYSVSVIEHMPAHIRKKVLARIARLARPGASLLLSVDLTPDSMDLWPLSEGKIVDADQPHGTFDTLLSELASVGVKDIETSFLRGIAGSRTDVALLKARCDVV